MRITKLPSLLAAATVVLVLTAANAKAETILIGGTSLNLIYNTETQTLCDEGGCALYDGINFNNRRSSPRSILRWTEILLAAWRILPPASTSM